MNSMIYGTTRKITPLCSERILYRVRINAEVGWQPPNVSCSEGEGRFYSDRALEAERLQEVDRESLPKRLASRGARGEEFSASHFAETTVTAIETPEEQSYIKSITSDTARVIILP